MLASLSVCLPASWPSIVIIRNWTITTKCRNMIEQHHCYQYEDTARVKRDDRTVFGDVYHAKSQKSQKSSNPKPQPYLCQKLSALVHPTVAPERAKE
jgi:hypothetical protein